MPAEAIDKFVLGRIAELARDQQMLDEHIRTAGAIAFRERDTLREGRMRIEEEIAKHLRDREMVLSRLIDSTVSTSFIDRKLAEIATTVEPLHQRAAEVIAEDKALDGVVIDTNFVREALKRLEAAIADARSPVDDL